MAYELVQDITVSSATTSVSFTGLNFTSADDLLLVSDVIGSGSGGAVALYVNSNTTATNYYGQQLDVYGIGISPYRYNFSRFLQFAGSGGNSFAITKIKLTNSGYFIFQSGTERFVASSSLEMENWFVTSTTTQSTITSLTITGTASNIIGTGSRFRLYKLVAEKVADITVSTATTSVDITGLSIDKGSEYMLVSSFSNGTGNSSSYSLYANNNTSATNYWVQNISAYSSTVSGVRANTSEIAYTSSTNTKSLCYSNIKLTNNGNVVSQHNEISRYDGGTSIIISNNNGTSTFIASSITQLTVSAGVANAIGVGSRFQLYKLR